MTGHEVTKKCFIGRSISVYRSALSKPNAFRNITSVGQPIEWGGMENRLCEENNREQEGRDRQNVEKTRRSAQARVGGASSILYGSAHFRVSAKMPHPFGRVARPLSQKGSRAAFLWYFLLQKQKKVHPKRNDLANQYHYIPKPELDKFPKICYHTTIHHQGGNTYVK